MKVKYTKDGAFKFASTKEVEEILKDAGWKKEEIKRKPKKKEEDE